MKKILPILVMLLITATAYNQSSRRTTNSQSAGRQNQQTNTTRTVERNTSTQSTGTTRVQQDPNTRNSGTRTQSETRQQTQRNSNDHGSRTTVTNTRTSTTTTYTTPRNSNTRENRDYTGNHYYTSPRERSEYQSPRVYRERHAPEHRYTSTPPSRQYRQTYYAYRAPVTVNVVWTPVMRRTYIDLYPSVRHWYYTDGYRIPTISAYDADYYMGEVMNVYGRVTDIYYSRTTDEYFLYFGLYYPYQDFTIVVPGIIARRYSHRPELYFTNQDILVTGLITAYDNSPEIYVKRDFQLRAY